MGPPPGDRRLVGASKAQVEKRLIDYVLNTRHPVGRHKARLFAKLGFELANNSLLADEIIRGLTNFPPVSETETVYGKNAVVEMPIHGPAGNGMIRTVWHYPVGETVPSLISAYVVRR